MSIRTVLAGLAVAGGLMGATIYEVELQTAQMVAHPAAPFYFAVQMADGSGTGNGNNAAILSGFDFGVGGSATGTPTAIGLAFGELSAGVLLTDGGPLNYFYQPFLPGSLLSFRLEVTLNEEPAGPDGLAFYILDSSFTPIPTTGGPPDAWLLVDIYPSGMLVQFSGGDTTRSPAAGGLPIGFDAGLRGVPEPVGYVPVGLLWLVVFRVVRGWRGRH